jgi:hypothetical protein
MRLHAHLAWFSLFPFLVTIAIFLAPNFYSDFDPRIFHRILAWILFFSSIGLLLINSGKSLFNSDLNLETAKFIPNGSFKSKITKFAPNLHLNIKIARFIPKIKKILNFAKSKPECEQFQINQSNISYKIESYSLTVLISIFLGVYLFHFFSITQGFYESFFLGERDFTSMAEVVLNLKKSFGFYSPFHEDGRSSYLSHHFAPMLVMFLPFSYLTGTRLFLAWGQIFYGLLIFVILFQYLKKKPFPLIEKYFLIIFFLGNIYLYRMITSYHFEILFVLFFLLMAYSIQEDLSLFWKLFWAACTILVKEDASIYLTIYFLGEIFYTLFGGKSLKDKSFIIYFLLFIISLSSFLIGIPELRKFLQVVPKEDWWIIWESWGNSSVSIITGILSHPMEALYLFFNHKSTILEIFLGTGLLLLFSPRYWFYTISLFAIHFLSSREWHNTFYNYYIYPLLPILLLSILDGWKNLRGMVNHRIAVICLLLALFFYRNSWDKNFPFGIAPTDSARIYTALEIGKMIPPSSKVATQFDLGIFVSNLSSIFPLTKEIGMMEKTNLIDKSNLKNNKILINQEIILNKESDNQKQKDFTIMESNNSISYIFIDTTYGFSPYIPLTTIQDWKKNWQQNGYQTIFSKNGMELLRKPDSIH